MTRASGSLGRPAPGAGWRRLRAVTTALRRLQRTRSRLLLVLTVAAALGLAALATQLGGGGARAIAVQLREGGLQIAVPITALVFAVASLGDLRDDGTLVYVWLRPLRRVELALAASMASAELVVPLNLAVVGAVVLLGGQPGLLPAAALAALLATAAYVALFVALGLRTSRSLLWGLGYLLLIEGFLSRFSDQIAAISVRRYAGSVFSRVSGIGAGSRDVSLTVAVAALLALCAVGLALTTWWLSSRDVP